MNQLKIYLPAMLLMFSTTAISQSKKPPLPPLPPPLIKHNNPAPPLSPPPELRYGYPATRNGKDVWVMKPRPIKPAIPPPPPKPIKD